MTEAVTRFEESLDADHVEVRKQKQLHHGQTFRVMKSSYGGVPWDFMYVVMEMNGALDGATLLSYIVFLDTVVQERLIGDSSAGEAHEKWPRCGQSRSGGAVTRYHQRGSPLTPHLRSRSLRPSTRPRIREVVNKLDALKSKKEGEGVNSCHCENKNAFNESSTDAEPKTWVTLSRNTTRTTTPRRRYRLMRPRWPRCLGGSCRIMRHGPWGGWQQLSSAASSATEMPKSSGTKPLAPMGVNQGPPKPLMMQPWGGCDADQAAACDAAAIGRPDDDADNVTRPSCGAADGTDPANTTG